MIHVIHNRQLTMGLALSCLLTLVALPVMAEQSKSSGGKTDNHNAEQMKGNMTNVKEGKLVLGELSRIEGEYYFIKKSDGNEVKLHVAQSTQQSGDLKQGDRIEAQVDDKNHVLSIHGEGSTDRRDSHYPDATRK